MWFAGIVNKYVLGGIWHKKKPKKKKWNLLDNNFNVKKNEGNGMFIQRNQYKQRIPSLDMFIQACEGKTKLSCYLSST